MQYYMTKCVCVCVLPILDRQREAERWPVPGWDQVSAASSREDRRIECFPRSNSITHHLLHPYFPLISLFPILTFLSTHFYLSALSICFPASASFPVSFPRLLSASVSVCLLSFFIFPLLIHPILAPPSSLFLCLSLCCYRLAL